MVLSTAEVPLVPKCRTSPALPFPARIPLNQPCPLAFDGRGNRAVVHVPDIAAGDYPGLAAGTFDDFAGGFAFDDTVGLTASIEQAKWAHRACIRVNWCNLAYGGNGPILIADLGEHYRSVLPGVALEDANAEDGAE